MALNSARKEDLTDPMAKLVAKLLYWTAVNCSADRDTGLHGPSDDQKCRACELVATAAQAAWTRLKAGEG